MEHELASVKAIQTFLEMTSVTLHKVHNWVKLKGEIIIYQRWLLINKQNTVLFWLQVNVEREYIPYDILFTYTFHGADGTNYLLFCEASK